MQQQTSYDNSCHRDLDSFPTTLIATASFALRLVTRKWRWLICREAHLTRQERRKLKLGKVTQSLNRCTRVHTYRSAESADVSHRHQGMGYNMLGRPHLGRACSLLKTLPFVDDLSNCMLTNRLADWASLPSLAMHISASCDSLIHFSVSSKL